MVESLTTSLALIELANSPEVMQEREFEMTAASLDVDQLLVMYEALRDTAPHRHDRNKKYFVGHSGIPPEVEGSPRHEEHLAIALCNQEADLPVRDSDGLRLLDYQVPFKAKQPDAAIGKADIVALTMSGRIAVVELKVRTDTSKGDNALRALLESLGYCAIVEANAHDIASEIMGRYGLQAVAGRPDLVVMGPEAYWSTWDDTALAAVYGLADRLARTFEMRIRFLDLGDVTPEMNADGERSRLIGRTSTTVKHDAEYR